MLLTSRSAPACRVETVKCWRFWGPETEGAETGNVVKTIINHPQITIFIGGINHQTWGGLLLFWPHHFITVTFVEQLTDLYTAKTRAMRWSPGILVPHTDKTPGFVWQTCYFYRAGPPPFLVHWKKTIRSRCCLRLGNKETWNVGIFRKYGIGGRKEGDMFQMQELGCCDPHRCWFGIAHPNTQKSYGHNFQLGRIVKCSRTATAAT